MASLFRGKVILCAAAACLGCAAAAEPGGTPPDALLAALRDPLLREVHLFRLRQGEAEPQTPEGAIGAVAAWAQGKAPRFYLDEQRRGTDFYLQPGIALGDDAAVRRGLLILEFGFTRMAPDGSFPGIPDVVHSAEFFLEGTARALLLLRQAHAPESAAATAELGPKLDRLTRWFLRRDVAWKDPARDLYPFNHRYYARAAGLAQASVVLGRPDLMDAADEYARAGMKLQRPDGVNPERGGYDVGYQVAGLIYAENYAFVCRDPSLRASMAAMTGKALDFMLRRTDEGGAVSNGASTRVAKEKDREGATKKINYAAYAADLVLAADLTGRTEFRRVAEAVIRNHVAGAAL